MEKVYVLFAVYGNPDGNTEYDTLGVFNTEYGALDAAQEYFVDHEREYDNELTVLLGDDPYMRISCTRADYERYLDTSEVYSLSYGVFGGLVIEETELQN